jgi:hypothetical protein
VLAWAGLASTNNQTIEHYNVAMNVAAYAGTDVDTFLWFVDEGMPPSSAFMHSDFDDRQFALLDDGEFMAWVEDRGVSTYTDYLVSHPAWALSKLQYLVVGEPESLVDHTDWVDVIDEPPGVDLWPKQASMFTVVIVASAVIASLVARLRGRSDRRWRLPSLLMASTPLHALLATHASPWEVARHGLVLAFVLLMCAIWMLALCADVVAGRHPQEPPRDSSGMATPTNSIVYGSHGESGHL